MVVLRRAPVAVGAILCLSLFLLATFAPAVETSGNWSQVFSWEKSQNGPSSIPTPTPSERDYLLAAIRSFDPAVAPLVSNAPDWVDQAASAGVRDAMQGDIAGFNHEFAKVAPSFTFGIEIAGVSLGAIAASACVFLGPETVGLACLAAGLIVVLAFFLGYWLGTSDANNAGELGTSIGVAKAIMVSKAQALDIHYADEETLASSDNATSNFLAYQASNAALSQLGNTTFNTPLALAQSGVASELAGNWFGMLTGVEQTVGQAYGSSIAWEGLSDSGGFYCPQWTILYNDTGTHKTLLTPGPNGTCGSPTPGSLQVPKGSLMLAPVYFAGYESAGAPTNSCPVVWVSENTNKTAATSPLNISASMNVLTPIVGPLKVDLFPVENGLPGAGLYAGPGPYPHAQSYNATASGVKWLWHALQKRSDAYYVCSPYVSPVTLASHPVRVMIPRSLPLNATSASGSMMSVPQAWYLPADNSEGLLGNIWKLSSIGAGGTQNQSICIGSANLLSLGTCWLWKYQQSVIGAPLHYPGGANVFNDFGTWMWNLANYAGSAAGAYYTFLRYGHGYTSESQVPANCNIPNPGQILPPNLGFNKWSSVNASVILNLYYAYQAATARVYNSSATLNSTTFCGTHVKLTTNDLSLALGTYAYGWAYIPGATHTSDGTGSQNFGLPKTWNMSGIIYLSPTSRDLNVTIGVPWLLPHANPTVVLAQPFHTGKAGNETTPVHINATGPSWCVLHATGCKVLGFDVATTPALVGNSSSIGGSQFPKNETPGTGAAVFLTACWEFKAGTNLTSPTYVRANGTCHFSVETMQTWVGSTSCSLSNPANCAAQTGCLVCGPVSILKCSGDTIPIFGTIADSVASWWKGATNSIPVIGGASFSCFIGWLAAVIVGLLGLLVIIAVVRAGWRSGK